MTAAVPDDVADLLTVLLARSVHPGDVVGVGLGTPLALVAGLLARHLDATVHVLAGGVMDRRGDVEAHLGVTDHPVQGAGHVSHLDSMDMAERQAMTLQFLRPAQIDGRRRLNTSRIGPVAGPAVRFPGGLATGDVTRLLPRVVVYHPDHRPRNLPETVDYVTGDGSAWSVGELHGGGVVRLVTDLAIFDAADTGWRLASVHPFTSVEEVRGATGFGALFDDPAETPMPTADELEALRQVDPRRRRDAEIPRSAPAGGRGR